MLKVNFYNSIDNSLVKFAVIISTYQGKWVLCKHRERSTYEFPGGHREDGENILATAKRELYEETGAIDYIIKQICVYSVVRNDGVLENQSEGLLECFIMLILLILISYLIMRSKRLNFLSVYLKIGLIQKFNRSY